jgi:hypothetical protein
VLWAAGELLHALLTRLRSDDGNLAAASVVGVGTTFRAMAVGIPLVAVTAADEAVGLSAALLYTLAFTLELALALVIYFGQEPKRL